MIIFKSTRLRIVVVLVGLNVNNLQRRSVLTLSVLCRIQCRSIGRHGFRRLVFIVEYLLDIFTHQMLLFGARFLIRSRLFNSS